ncbi:MAG: dienelactone hydrolase family protein [Candidatus Nitrosopolaris sp.]
MKKRSDVIFTYVFFIIACLVLSTINTIYKVIPLTLAQTNADVLSTNNKSATNGTMTNSTATNEGLQINKVKYFDNVSGYLVYPSASAITINSSTAAAGKELPAVIMIHEYWGLNDNIKNMARTLAKQAGYVVLAVDLFEGQSTKDPNQARQLMKSVIDNPQGAISNLQAAVKYVSSLPLAGVLVVDNHCNWHCIVNNTLWPLLYYTMELL